MIRKISLHFEKTSLAQLQNFCDKNFTPVRSRNRRVRIEFENNNFEIYNYIAESYYHDHCHCDEWPIAKEITEARFELEVVSEVRRLDLMDSLEMSLMINL